MSYSPRKWLWDETVKIVQHCSTLITVSLFISKPIRWEMERFQKWVTTWTVQINEHVEHWCFDIWKSHLKVTFGKPQTDKPALHINNLHIGSDTSMGDLTHMMGVSRRTGQTILYNNAGTITHTMHKEGAHTIESGDKCFFTLVSCIKNRTKEKKHRNRK